jgi:hypothetical protein
MLGTGMMLLGAGIVSIGVITLVSEKSFEVLEKTDLISKPIVKKALNSFCIDVVDFSEDERMAVLSRLDYQVKLFAEDWEEGQRNSFEVPLPKLGIDDEAIGVKREIEELRNQLVYLPSVEDIELSEDRYNLIVTVDESVLKACYEAQLQEWTTQGQLERVEYYRSRGVI